MPNCAWSRHASNLSALVTFAVACAPPPPPQYPPPPGQPAAGAASVATQSGAKPRWVDGAEPIRFPRHTSLTGVGHGPNRQSCEADARAAVAKIFRAHVSQVHRDVQSHFSRVNAAGRISVEAMSVDQFTRVTTDYTLKGVEIGQVWQDNTNASFHCLGVLDRVSTAQTLRGEIQRLDAQITAAVRQGDASADNETARFLAYKRALLLMQRREALNADLRIVDPQRRGLPPPISWSALVAKFSRAKSGVRIGLHVKGRERARVQSCLAEHLAKRDIQVQEGTSDVNLWIHGKIEMKKAGYNLGTQMVRATINMRITNAVDGQTVGAFSRYVKAGRRDIAQSLQLAASKLCHDVAPKLAQEIDKALGR